MLIFAKITSAILTALLTVTNLFAGSTGDSVKAISDYEEGCNMSFAAVSDVHLDDNIFCEYFLDIGLLDMSNAEDRLDAVLFDGDNTNLGKIGQYERLTRTLTGIDFTDQIIMAIGNHDSWCGTSESAERDPETSISNFCKYTSETIGRDIDKPYYTTEINGYPVIVLGSEGNGEAPTISDTQVEWFRAEMSKAGETGLPIFVFLHQPFNQTHGLPYSWSMVEEEDINRGGIGDNNDEILEIVQSYDNVFFFSGHIHGGFCNGNEYYTTVERHDGYTLINLPSFGKGDEHLGERGYTPIGTGFVVEVYENKVMLRARNFTTGMWLSRYDQTIELV